jgi:hypothetical protein
MTLGSGGGGGGGGNTARASSSLTSPTGEFNDDSNGFTVVRPSLAGESLRSWDRARMTPRAEPEPTKSSLLLQNVTAQKVLELSGPSRGGDRSSSGPQRGFSQRGGGSGVRGAAGGPTVDTDNEEDDEGDLLDLLPLEELYERAGVTPPPPPADDGPQQRAGASLPSGRGETFITSTGLISVPKQLKASGGVGGGGGGGTAATANVAASKLNTAFAKSVSTQVTSTELAEYVSRWAKIRVDPRLVEMPYDVRARTSTGVACVTFPHTHTHTHTHLYESFTSYSGGISNTSGCDSPARLSSGYLSLYRLNVPIWAFDNSITVNVPILTFYTFALSNTAARYIHLPSRHDLLRVTRMRAGVSDASALREEAVRRDSLTASSFANTIHCTRDRDSYFVDFFSM